MLKKAWLRDYDLVAMKRNIMNDLMDGKEVDDCIVTLPNLLKRVIELENKRITDNNDYISIPIKDWLDFKEEITPLANKENKDV